MLKVALSHDVDRTRKTYQYITHLLRSLKNGKLENLLYHLTSVFRENPYWNFGRITDIENSYGVKSTFFFLNETIKFSVFNPRNWVLALGRYDINAEPIQKMIRWLDKNGWEIGLHGSYNSYKNIELLRWEKQVLENILGHEVVGARQHYLNLESTKTWEMQKTLGLKYDSSFGFRDKIGFKENRFLPFHPFNDEFMAIPQLVMDTCFMGTKNKWRELLRLLDECETKNGVLVLNWHNCVFNESEYPGYIKYYRLIIEECFKRGAVFLKLSEVLDEYTFDDEYQKNGYQRESPIFKIGEN